MQRLYNACMKHALILAILSAATVLTAADPITSSQAKDHIGETVTVCGPVADTRHLDSGSGHTFLNFDKHYPDHTFTAFIDGQDHAKFGTPEKDYLDKEICVTGKIQQYNGKPEIVLTSPEQVKVKGK
jgi:hypothetical protein